MFRPRNALILGALFVAVGAAYLWLQGSGGTMDRAGGAMLIVLGAAMAFAFLLLLRGAEE